MTAHHRACAEDHNEGSCNRPDRPAAADPSRAEGPSCTRHRSLSQTQRPELMVHDMCSLQAALGHQPPWCRPFAALGLAWKALQLCDPGGSAAGPLYLLACTGFRSATLIVKARFVAQAGFRERNLSGRNASGFTGGVQTCCSPSAQSACPLALRPPPASSLPCQSGPPPSPEQATSLRWMRTPAQGA